MRRGEVERAHALSRAAIELIAKVTNVAEVS
jgi:hypothetical protein